jgi:diacylglycerol kinase (ATP)
MGTESEDVRNKFTRTGAAGDPLRKLRNAGRGLAFAFTSDFSVTYKVVISALLLAASYYFRFWVDFAVIVVVTGMVLTAELFNTAVEGICDFVSPGHDERIGTIKDVAAAAAAISILVWIGVVLYEAQDLIRRALS